MERDIRLSIITQLTSIHEFFSHKKGNGFSNTVKKDMSFLNSLENPKDDIERGHHQYLCQCFNNNSKVQRCIYDVVSIIAIFPLMLYFLVARIFEKKYKHCDAVMTKDYYERKIMPKELDARIASYEVVGYEKGSLSKKDCKFILGIFKRYYVDAYFVFRCMTRLATYSRMIHIYSPKMICASCEYSCTSSVLTVYCEINGVEHIDIMHGEKLLNIRESFSRFTYFYLWDEHYVYLFKKLRANKTKYIVSRPEMPILIKKENLHPTYYLQLHTKEELCVIANSMEKVSKNYIVRPHPSHFTGGVREVFENYHIEDPKYISIWDSLAAASLVISIDSTVLLQAYWLDIPVVIDDISNPSLYKALYDRKYIMMSKPHKLLSDMINTTTL